MILGMFLGNFVKLYDEIQFLGDLAVILKTKLYLVKIRCELSMRISINSTVSVAANWSFLDISAHKKYNYMFLISLQFLVLVKLKSKVKLKLFVSKKYVNFLTNLLLHEWTIVHFFPSPFDQGRGNHSGE